MSEISSLGALTAFAAGIVSFLSPCVLPLVPGYVSYVAGHTLVNTDHHMKHDAHRLSALGLSLCFVLGFSTVFIALGASVTALGQLLLRYRYETNIAGGIIVIVFGLFMTEVLKLPWMEHDLRFHTKIRGARPLAAYLLGLAFAFGWTPCIGPVLGAILTVTAVSSVPFDGVALLGLYSAGLGVPFLLAAAFTGVLTRHLKLLRHLGRPLQIVAGIIMVVMGIAMLTGQLTAFSWWLLRTLPALGRIG